ncbi:Putative SKP1/BTB/POZ domain superfamily protein [Septoria linicola]|uniref:SKP1/BTB/POZ domain superfamily protein n=1 Tax=Septoria linicola TaxID=215465 RepID=A0A9Q9EM68_9PEZI|nr:Putative SKP1/BTB/POZ domain superfamily protein [Septoria linicola]
MADDLVEIDPSGDVVLVCGHGEDVKKLRVSSGTLSLASPVFKTMLGPNFKEDKQLSGCGTLHLPLPDDDGAQMAIICNTIHLRHNKVPRRLTLTQLSEVAILVNKYDCAMALGPMAEHWSMESTEWKQETLDNCTYKGKTVNTCFCDSGQAHGSAEIRNRFMGQVKTIRSAMPVACLECTLEGSVWKKADCKHVHDSTSSFGI